MVVSLQPDLLRLCLLPFFSRVSIILFRRWNFMQFSQGSSSFRFTEWQSTGTQAGQTQVQIFSLDPHFRSLFPKTVPSFSPFFLFLELRTALDQIFFLAMSQARTCRLLTVWVWGQASLPVSVTAKFEVITLFRLRSCYFGWLYSVVFFIFILLGDYSEDCRSVVLRDRRLDIFREFSRLWTLSELNLRFFSVDEAEFWVFLLLFFWIFEPFSAFLLKYGTLDSPSSVEPSCRQNQLTPSLSSPTALSLAKAVAVWHRSASFCV